MKPGAEDERARRYQERATPDTTVAPVPATDVLELRPSLNRTRLRRHCRISRQLACWRGPVHPSSSWRRADRAHPVLADPVLAPSSGDVQHPRSDQGPKDDERDHPDDSHGRLTPVR